MKTLILILVCAFFCFAIDPSMFTKDLSINKDNFSELSTLNGQNDFSQNLVHEPIDPEKYIVGPGDLFKIIYWGNVTEEELEAKINPEGNLIIPKIGITKLKGLTLKQAKTQIDNLIKSKTIKTKTIIQLKNVKSIVVSVAGEVKYPGSFQFNSTVKLSQILTKTYDKNLLNNNTADFRNVCMYKNKSKCHSIDFLNYLRNGKEKCNPYIFSGYKIIIPTKTCSLSITGAVARPGYYSYRRENLNELIDFCGGLVENADTNDILVTSFKEDGTSVKTIKLVYPNQTKDYLVKKDDFIVVGSKPYWHEYISVGVKGRVRNPGLYNIKKGTKISDFINLCGGILDDAELDIAYLSREGYIDPNKFNNYMKFLNSVLVSNAKMLNTNFSKAIINKDKDYNKELKDGDILYIPKKIVTVSVIGEVVNPGLVDYKKNYDWKNYIAQAGGFNKFSFKRKTIIYRRAKGAWTSVKDVDQITPGDIIYVPTTPEDYIWNKFKDILAVSGGTISILTSLIVLLN